MAPSPRSSPVGRPLSPRTTTNSPCCGKRPRNQPEDDGDKEDQVTITVATSSSFDYQEDDVKKDGATKTSLASTTKEAQEPHAKIRRSSPVPSQQQQQKENIDDEEDAELRSINQQQVENANKKEEDLDVKLPAKDIVLLEKDSKDHHDAAVSLPLAPDLREYMKPGATKRFRPRPEWYLGNQNGNAAARLVGNRSPVPIPVEGSGAAALEPPPPADADNDIAVIQAQQFQLPHGLMIAPDDGLLPDDVFDAFAGSVLQDHHSSNPNNADNPTRQGNDSQILALFHTPSSQSQDATRTINDNSIAPYTFGRDFDPALHVTVKEGANEAAMALLEHGASVDSENAKGVTPLIIASQKGNVEIIRELLRRGAQPSKSSANGTTPVLQAAHFGHLECIEMLLDAGGTGLIEMANFNYTTPLMRASQEGHVHVVNALLDRGASVNRRNRVQMTALMLASQRGHSNVCQTLVERGAELDSMTAQHSTSLLLACKRGHLDVVRTLVTAGCELWVRDSRGRCAREIAQRRNLKDVVDLLDASVQLDLIQRQQRQKRSYTMVLLWKLLQKERAMVPMHNQDDAITRQVTIHRIAEELRPETASLSLSSLQRAMPPTLPYHLSQPSTQALLRAMTLPAPLVELITKFLPYPSMWERRIGMLTKRCVINADASVACALDLVDEILEEGGFVEACDFAKVTPPTHFASWRDWKIHTRLRCRRGGPTFSPDDHSRERPSATTARVPKPQSKEQASVVDMRRQVGFLQILANRTPLLAHVLSNPPYNMPGPLIQQLITTSDIQSLVRRLGSRGLHFEPTVAMDLVMLVSRLSSWYSREREEKPYPIYPAVVHPPLPQRKRRPLPMRVPMVTLTQPFEYRPRTLQQQQEEERSRPSAPAPMADDLVDEEM